MKLETAKMQIDKMMGFNLAPVTIKSFSWI